MTNVIVLESHISGRFDASQQALAAAKSGITWGTNYVQNGGTNISDKEFTLYDPIDASKEAAKYYVTVAGTTITSVGTVDNGAVSRKLVYEYEDDNFQTIITNDIVSNQLVNSSTDDGSFSYQYEVWMKDLVNPSLFGITDLANNEITVEIDPSSDNGKATLSVKAGAGSAATKVITNLRGNDSTLYKDIAQPYMIVTLSYYKGVGVELEMDTKYPETTPDVTKAGANMCHKRITVSTQGKTLNFEDAHFVATAAPTISTAGDGESIDTGYAYIDAVGQMGLLIGSP